MSSAMPWFPFFPSDWLAGTRGLSANATAAYITILALIYEKDGPIKADSDWLARYCSMTHQQFQKALNSLVAKGKIQVLENGGLWNERAGKEIQKRNKARTAQKSKADSRWAKKRSNIKDASMPQHISGMAPAYAGSMPTRVQTQSQKIKEAKPIGFAKKKSVANRLSENWKIPPAWVAEAVAEGMPHATAMAEAERMKNWSLSNKNGAKLDWHATWLNWFRKSMANPSTAPPRSAPDQETEEAQRFLAGIIAKGEGHG